MNLMKPADATRLINKLARAPHGPNLILTLHVDDRLEERGLVMGDLLHLLKFGFVLEEGEASTRPNYFKYCIEGTTPNSDGRHLCAIVIPHLQGEIKVVTIMWKDEK